MANTRGLIPWSMEVKRLALNQGISEEVIETMWDSSWNDWIEGTSPEDFVSKYTSKTVTGETTV